ncbi:MAG: class A beta-lactamase-related serine hydrolase [Gammaproteobacteria bacterium]|nr:class A beta-lactamase-related serine hydrolase [Gammaproteobacteria bacterium]MBU1555463.1 class A beta-lactamase-related serine hydrolase [Gammaproteobacteria bacterium]MBU2069801.1 class A beta-lactamase-related serine hydrolase [Gammaproteobacteria bacterium]MBU2180220.1 class A beta-lactamase-related serine hydrolase [Gammaproteobacteria bacterium]
MQKLTLFLLFLCALQAVDVKASTEIQFQPLQLLLSQATGQYPILQQVLSNPEPYRVQVIYTRIDRDVDNIPHLTYYQYGLDDNRYFYPASTVKLPIALLALEWLAEQNVADLNADTTMLTDAATDWQTSQTVDQTAAKGLPSIAQYIKKVLLVSDNDGSNRLYELLGQDFINQRLAAKGLEHSLINHRLSVSLTAEQNRQVNPIRFVDSHGKPILALPARNTEQQYINSDKPTLGKAYISGTELINAPMDFTEKNRFSLTDFDGVIKRVIFPQLFKQKKAFNIKPEDRDLILRYMAMLPPDSISPVYDAEQYPDNYSKFLLFGGKEQQIPAHIRIFNKTGWAYGHIIDGAYVVDLQHKIEFFITAVIYANENDTLNDDLYQRNEIALPFMRQLGEYLYQHELNRPTKYKPDLTEAVRVTASAAEID